jgi:heme/copper-type cytochrome/quinol oxidase subunit 2
MLGLRLPYRRSTQDEAEKPFWISFSDMMTALMVLFLVVMTVTLLAVTHTISQTERMKTARDAEINKLMAKIR